MTKKNILIKTKCICGGKLKKKINFGDQPLINNFKTVKTIKYPTVITQCSKCYLVQLKYSVKDNVIYPRNYSYLSGDSKEKIEDFKNLILKLSSNFKIKKPEIIDIGGNDGSLMQIAKARGYTTTNVEPTRAANLSIRKGVNTIQKKFDFKLVKTLRQKKIEFDFVVSTNFFAHTNNLKEIISGVKNILNDNGILIIEIQYLYKVLKVNGFDSFHQDHKYYYTLSSLKKILHVFNLNIFDAEFLKNQKEILRIYADKNNKKNTSRLYQILKSENDFKVFEKVKKLNNFRIKHIFKIKKLIKKLILQNKQIFAISASPRGCVLLNSANFTRKNIKFVGEVPGSFKLKKFIPGTNIPIVNENKIVKEQPDFIIILAWHLKYRLIKILVKKGYKGKFIAPLPKLEIS